ncbi:SIR2 family protein [Idiomarina sp. ST10R2A5]|uniref:SIR2 family protein n=1 Tax=Idiomarina sp. ST10R2A5 TaxID=3418368 RepID=UPI003EC5D824
MRFYSDGPNIPDSLLTKRDRGRVVFLCGAGVSINSGMPSFFELTKHVVDFFDPPKNSNVYIDFIKPLKEGKKAPEVPLDQVFHSLYQEYGKAEVNELVTEKLSVANTDIQRSKNHEIISTISADQSGKPQIVTTNFDLLFEFSENLNASNISVPPNFPNIEIGATLAEITYLHGRLQESASTAPPYVLSSADFGRAYLSEGWATNFVRSLLKHYTVVLLGYSAEDPPVKYLLQGLNQGDRKEHSNIFAFDKGKFEDIESKWRDRGVIPIAYKDHSKLWESLDAWAERASSPRNWRANVLAMAMQGPRELKPYERGQVVHMVSTTPGARLFAKATPPPPAEWVCVFDNTCRSSEKSSSYIDPEDQFDPYFEYRLDDDPIPSRKQLHSHDPDFKSVLKWNKSDEIPTSPFQLAGVNSTRGWELPTRLIHLSNWIIAHTGSPIIAWWLARKPGLHPYLADGFKQQLRANKALTQEIRSLWDNIITYQNDPTNFFWDGRWFDIKERLKVEGWSPAVLRDLESATSPTVKVTRPHGIAAARPPIERLSETPLSEIANLEVCFPDRHGENIEVPDDSLVDVFSIAERTLHRTSLLHEQINTVFLTEPTCYPDRDIEGQNIEPHITFNWFMELFSKLISKKPSVARGYATLWSPEREIYFRRLKLFALNQAELFNADEAIKQLLNFSQPAFWDPKVSRELLFFLLDRWPQFSEKNKRALINRILEGPDKPDYLAAQEYVEFKNRQASLYVQWLTSKGISLTQREREKLKHLTSSLAKWDDNWAAEYTKERLPTVRTVGVNENHEVLNSEPIGTIVNKAREAQVREPNSYSDKRPFTGLVKHNPRKALSALSYLARNDEYPSDFWRNLIEEWPQNTSSRLFETFVRRLGKLPEKTVQSLNHSVGKWIQENILNVHKYDEVLALDTFDHLVHAIINGGEVCTRSAIGQVTKRGKIVENSRRTFSHSKSSPIGNALDGLLSILNSLNSSVYSGLPQKIKSRLDKLLDAPGEGADHSVSILAFQLGWLYFLDSQWVNSRVISWFNFDSAYSEPAWNGFLYSGRLPPDELLNQFAPLLFNLFPTLHEWSWGHEASRVSAQLIIEIAIFKLDKVDQNAESKVRNAIRDMDDKARQVALNRLAVIGNRENDGWSNHVIPFVNKIWPRERKYRTSSLSNAWVTMILDSGISFPNVLRSTSRFLTQIRGNNHSLYNLTRESKEQFVLTTTYPTDVLELLDLVISNDKDELPYELSTILELIEEAEPSLTIDIRYMRLMQLIEHT